MRLQTYRRTEIRNLGMEQHLKTPHIVQTCYFYCQLPSGRQIKIVNIRCFAATVE